MSQQSTRHVCLIEPVIFVYNSQTASTNDYQMDAHESPDDVNRQALAEFRQFRNKLVDAGVYVTTLRGDRHCPDAIFPNWFSTHDDRTLVIYPMLVENRRRERLPHMISFLRQSYALKLDMSPEELSGRALESTGSLVLDRVNMVAYIARSLRTDEGLARTWCQRMGYEPIFFDTTNHAGKPVYHTDVVMWIGTNVAGICAGAITESDRARVIAKLSQTHEVVEFDQLQLRSFCGNALEVKGDDDQPFLVMSERAYGTLTSEQLSRLNRYYSRIITSPLTTIETYGGGSARCMIQELF